MRTRQRRSYRKFAAESLETRALLSGGLDGHDILRPGTLDPRFGVGGFVTSAILGTTDDNAAGVAIQKQADGKIVVAGTARGVTSQSALALTRENADGSLDTSFGKGGTVITDFPVGTIGEASALAIQSNGKIVVAGTIDGNVNGNFVDDYVLARYNANGSLDTSFGNGGEVFASFGPNGSSDGSDVAVTPAGKIIVSGTISLDGGDFAMAQYNSDGSLDQTFGTGGDVVTNFGPSILATSDKVALSVLPNGQIVQAGTVFNFATSGTEQFGLARYNANGSLDPNFGTGGLVTTQVGSPGSDAFQVAGIGIEPGTGAIVVAGSVQSPQDFRLSFALARYNAGDGSLDQTFGTGGEVITPTAPGTVSTATGIAIQPDGAIVLSGTVLGEDSDQNEFSDLAVTRYKAADGSLDTGFGTGGETLTSFGPGTLTTGSGVTIQADGKIVAAATVGGSVVGGLGVARYTPKGALDAKFGIHGEAIINVPMPASMGASSEAIQSDGKIVVAGSAVVIGPGDAQVSEIVLTRFNKDGSLDKSFGTNGSVITHFSTTGGSSAVGVTIEHDGRILVAADVSLLVDNQFAQDIGVVQYNPDGSLDRSFGHGGEVLIDFGAGITASASGLAIENDGTIVVSGTTAGFDSNFNFFQDFALAALNKNGSVDNAFGTHGQVVTSFGANTPATSAGIAIEKDGKIVVAGTATDPNTFNNEFALARYNTNGKLDNSFGTGGEVITSFGPNAPASIKSVAIQPDGKIVVAGSTTDPTTFDDEFALARYNTNGKLDNSFGTGGEVTTSFGANTSSDGASVAIQPDGEIVVAGTVEDFSNGFTQGFGLARYNPNGTLDQTFGTAGEVVTNFGPNTFATAVDVVIGDDGELFVAGTLVGNNFSDFLLASYVGKKGDHHG